MEGINDSKQCCYDYYRPGPLFLITWINFNPNMDE